MASFEMVAQRNVRELAFALCRDNDLWLSEQRRLADSRIALRERLDSEVSKQRNTLFLPIALWAAVNLKRYAQRRLADSRDDAAYEQISIYNQPSIPWLFLDSKPEVIIATAKRPALDKQIKITAIMVCSTGKSLAVLEFFAVGVNLLAVIFMLSRVAGFCI